MATNSLKKDAKNSLPNWLTEIVSWVLVAVSFIIPIVGVVLFYLKMNGPIDKRTTDGDAKRGLVSSVLGVVLAAIGYFGAGYLYYFSVLFFGVSLESFVLGIVISRRAWKALKNEKKKTTLAQIGFWLGLSPFLMIFILLFIEQNF